MVRGIPKWASKRYSEDQRTQFAKYAPPNSPHETGDQYDVHGGQLFVSDATKLLQSCISHSWGYRPYTDAELMAFVIPIMWEKPEGVNIRRKPRSDTGSQGCRTRHWAEM